MVRGNSSFFLSGEILLWIIIILVFVSVFLAVFQGIRLMRRYYAQPYSLAAASIKQKAIWALHMSLWETSWFIFVVYLFSLTTASHTDKLGLIPICGGIWLLVLLFLMLTKIRDMNRWVRIYKKWDSELRSGGVEVGTFQKHLTRNVILRFLKTEEMQQFVIHGYSRKGAS